MTAALVFLKNNWRTLAVLALLGATFASGRHAGLRAERALCEASLQAARTDLQKEKDVLQVAADRAAQVDALARQKAEETLADVRRRLANERKKNATFDTCRAGSDFLLLYAETAGSGAVGNASR